MSEDNNSAKHRLKLSKTPGRDDIPAALLGSCGSVADISVYTLCLKRIAGGEGHTGSIDGWSALMDFRKSRRCLEHIANWRPPFVCGTIFKL